MYILCCYSADSTGAECSDRGTCECGKCDCNDPIFVKDVRDSFTLYNVTSTSGLIVLVCTVHTCVSKDGFTI